MHLQILNSIVSGAAAAIAGFLWVPNNLRILYSTSKKTKLHCTLTLLFWLGMSIFGRYKFYDNRGWFCIFFLIGCLATSGVKAMIEQENLALQKKLQKIATDKEKQANKNE